VASINRRSGAIAAIWLQLYGVVSIRLFLFWHRIGGWQPAALISLGGKASGAEMRSSEILIWRMAAQWRRALSYLGVAAADSINF